MRNRHVALLEIQGKEFQLTPIPLSTVRPFVIEDIHLVSASEEEGFDISDNVEIAKFLKSRVNALIGRANEQWEERNAQAKGAGETELKPMLPLIRLKVDFIPSKPQNCYTQHLKPGRRNRRNRNV
jgi:double-strand break repair protein MRE11